VRLVAGAFSDVGQVREGNEDAHLVDDRLTLFAVADGMGGHRGGEVASWTAIEALRAAVAHGKPVHEAITTANTAVLEKAADEPELAGMGTTMTVLVPAGPASLLIGHVGDSRAYLLRGDVMQRVTEDHSLVEELVREGRLTAEQAESHPQRAIITRALGVDDDVEVDLYTITVRDGDRVVLCSDGLTTMVRDRDVERIARGEQDPQRAAEALVDAANAAGGEDNITVVVVDVSEVGDAAGADPEALAADIGASTPAPVRPADVDVPLAALPHASRRRRIRGIALLVVPLLAILLVSVAVLGWYARRSYYVGVDGETVVLYQGVPGGVLGWNPTVERRTDLSLDDLAATQRLAVVDGAARGSRERAERYLERLVNDATTTTSSTTTSTSGTSSTTRPPGVTTTAPGVARTTP
jgi:protein phosphatase